MQRQLSNLGFETTNKWLASMGLSNLTSKYDEIYDKLNEIETEDEFFAYINTNSKFVSIQETHDGEEEVKQETNLIQNHFANEDFIYRIGEKTIDIRKHFKLIPSLTKSCGNPAIAILTKPVQGCKKARRAVLEATAVISSEGETSITILHKMELIAKKKRFCIWVKYNTLIEFTPDPTMVSETAGLTFDFPLDQSDAPFGGNTCLSCKSITLFGSEAQEFSDGDPALPNLISAFGMGTTRGIGNEFVVLNCND